MELLILCVVGLLFYLTPTIIANHRRHPQVGAIAALNILLGWSQLGWVAAFVWALTNTETGGEWASPSDLYVNADNDNPYHPLSPAGQAWARGVADRAKF